MCGRPCGIGWRERSASRRDRRVVPCREVGLEASQLAYRRAKLVLPTPGVTVADPDGLLFPDGVGELRETAVLLGDDEVLIHCSSSSYPTKGSERRGEFAVLQTLAVA